MPCIACRLSFITKMTYPGLVLLVGVGIGLATFLYHVFTERNRFEDEQQYSSRNRRSSNHYDDWTERSHRSENAFLSRRSSSNFSREIDLAICSICQYTLNELNILQLHPCKHNFHTECINELWKFDPQAPCPNCRRQINMNQTSRLDHA